MPVASVFHGTASEAWALQLAIVHNCTCARNYAGVISGQCGAHRALLDQRFIDGCLFARYLLDRLAWEEFCPTSSR